MKSAIHVISVVLSLAVSPSASACGWGNLSTAEQQRVLDGEILVKDTVEPGCRL